MGQDNLELLSPGEVARRIGLSDSGLRKAAREGRIPHGIQITGSRRRVWLAADVEVMKEALRNRRSATAAANGVAA